MALTLATPNTRHLITTKVVDYINYEVLIRSVRTDVFVHEQCIPAELEMDSQDWISQHVLAQYEGHPIGTGRLTPEGRIGRVAVSRSMRRRGVGFCIMQQLLDLAEHNRHREVVLSAQCHAIEFYEKLGFQTAGDKFLEVGIPHVMMRKQLLSR